MKRHHPAALVIIYKDLQHVLLDAICTITAKWLDMRLATLTLNP